MPTEEYEYDNFYYEGEVDEMSDVSSKKNNTFIKIKQKNKKNKVVIGYDDYGNETCIFGSRGQGTYIHSATTGHRTNYKVGSSDENLFFSVIDSRSCDKNKEPIFFYFDSPEQVERVMGKKCVISQKTKEGWHKKFIITKQHIINRN
jgi:hypothetical protein